MKQGHYKRSNLHWYSFLLASGAASTAVEIAGLRLLAPLFGSSLPVWGTAIAVVIGGLAWGYSLGGKRAEGNVNQAAVMRQAALAATLFLWLPAIFLLATRLRTQFLAGSISAFLLASLLTAFLALLPPTVLFGMISPLAVQVEASRRRQQAGRVAGRVLTLTTVGGLIGILVPSFITIPFLGTRQTIWLFAGLVLSLSLPTIMAMSGRRTALFIFTAAAVVSSLFPHPLESNAIFADETPYQHVVVHQENGDRLLTFDADLGTQSRWTPNTYTNGYWDYLAALPALLPYQENSHILVLGSAASTTERQMKKFWRNTRQFTFTSVDIDGALANIANTYFDPPDREIIAADARSFIVTDSKTYDLIVIDAYAREITIPSHLTTKQFFAELRPRLHNNGLVAINLNTTAPDTLLVQSIARTVQTSFPHVRLTSIPDSCNLLLLASPGPISSPIITDQIPAVLKPLLPTLEQYITPITAKGLLLSDNRAPTEWLSLTALLRQAPENMSCASSEAS